MGFWNSPTNCLQVSSRHTTGCSGSYGRLYTSSTFSMAQTNAAFCSGGIHHIFFRHGFIWLFLKCGEWSHERCCLLPPAPPADPPTDATSSAHVPAAEPIS